MKAIRNYLTQWSTWRGLALIAAAISGIHPDAANALVTVGDAIVSQQSASVVAIGAVGAWEAFRNERKHDKTLLWRP
ncbi:hypothetical protein [Shewanella sp. YLB-07]|uniref:hypothetical protein n=1 Tax=Shewanella sp. YLB-07 TaxID=2601268 RepID=UPI00128B9494|nr:hypothetical protein [Shewanella sp. YLB-07]MPY23925.1 hypothetical protein [Shewanella sp. YLB-07]